MQSCVLSPTSHLEEGKPAYLGRSLVHTSAKSTPPMIWLVNPKELCTVTKRPFRLYIALLAGRYQIWLSYNRNPLLGPHWKSSKSGLDRGGLRSLVSSSPKAIFLILLHQLGEGPLDEESPLLEVVFDHFCSWYEQSGPCQPNTFGNLQKRCPIFIFFLVTGIRWIPQYPLIPTEISVETSISSSVSECHFFSFTFHTSVFSKTMAEDTMATTRSQCHKLTSKSDAQCSQRLPIRTRLDMY